MMAEVKRVLLQRKMLLFAVAVSIINIVLFFGVQITDSDVGNIFTYQERKKQLLGTENGLLEKNIGEKLLHIQEARMDMKNETEDDLATNQVLLSYMTTYDYQMDYPEKLQNIYKEVEEMNEIGIFAEESSFSQKSLQKTKKDYSKLENITLSMGEDKVVTSVLEYRWCVVLLFLFGIKVVASFLEERRNDMHQVVIASAGGRGNIAFWRCLIMLVSIGIMGAVLLAENILIAVWIYGADVGWSRKIQSVMLLQDCTLQVTISQFLALLYVYLVLGSLALCFIVWCWLFASKNWKLSMISIGVLTGIEYLIYRYASVTSALGILKHMNVFSVLFIKNNFTEYCNIPIGLGLVGKAAVLLGLELAVSIAGICIVTVLGMKQRLVRVKAGQNRIKEAVLKGLDRAGLLNIYNMELYRVLFLKKGILALFVAGAAMSLLSAQNKVYYTKSQAEMNRFCMEYGGAMTEEFYTAAEEVQKRAETIENDWKKTEKEHKKGAISDEEYEVFKMQYQRDSSKVTLAENISEKVKRLEDIQNRTGSKVWFVNERGYEKLFGSKRRHMMRNVIIFFAVIVLLTGLSFEGKQKGMDLATYATVNGRKYLLYKKMQLSVLIVTITAMVVYGMEICRIHAVYPLYSLPAPVQSVELLQNFPISCPIWAYLIYYYGIRIAVWCILGVAIVLVEQFDIKRRTA